MSSTSRQVSDSRVIAASAADIFNVLADPSKHREFDGSGSLIAAQGNPPRLQMGSKFGMKMKIGLPYTMKNTVVEFEEGRQIGWRHIGRHIWRYELEAVDGGTKVTETFDWAPALSPWMIEKTGSPKKNLASIEKSLERLDAYVTGGAASGN